MAEEKVKDQALAVPKKEVEFVSVMGFSNSASFELLQRQAKLLAASELVPKEFQGKIPNVVIALELASRTGASPISVMQNLYIVHGKPSWSSQFIIAAINNTKRYSPLRYDITGEGDDRTCIAWAVEKATGERLESPPVTIKMARDEGWLTKNGSKWKTMPELMLRYRSATFFGRLYAPEILMGMQTQEEVIDIGVIDGEVTASEIEAQFEDKKPEKVPASTVKKRGGKKKGAASVPKDGELPLAEGPTGGCTEDPETCGYDLRAENDIGCSFKDGEYYQKNCPFKKKVA